MRNTPAKIDLKAVYASIASRIPADAEQYPVLRKKFVTWMMIDDIATARTTLISLWYRIVGSPFVSKYDEVRQLITIDKTKLLSVIEGEREKERNTHDGSVCIHPVDGDRYIIIDDEREVRE